MSGVKGENSLKLFGDHLDELTRLAEQIQQVMGQVRGVADAGVFKVNGQPSMVIDVNRARAARYGIAPADVNAAVQAAVGGAPVTQMIEGDRRFDITLAISGGRSFGARCRRSHILLSDTGWWAQFRYRRSRTSRSAKAAS